MQFQFATLESRPRTAFTLIEMLVAMACTLVMMGAVVGLFGVVGDSVSGSRATIEISERLRNVRNRLQLDLAGATVTPRPPQLPEADGGYLEIQEGPNSELYGIGNPAGSNRFKFWMVGADNDTFKGALGAQYSFNNGVQIYNGSPGYDLTGDADDVLMLTTHTRGAPFIGRFTNASTGGSTTVESGVAEVIWYAVEQPLKVAGLGPKLYTLYRRQLLVLPQAASNVATADFTNLNTHQFTHRYDLSARFEQGQIVLNSLGDLCKREARWYHWFNGNVVPNAFPFRTAAPFYLPINLPPAPLHLDTTFDRTGEDVILTDVLSFDVKVYDSLAPLTIDTSAVENPQPVLTPSDPGYVTAYQNGQWATLANGMRQTGAFVDLNYGVYLSSPPDSEFSGRGQAASRLAYDATASQYTATYDVWSLHYENNNMDEDQDTIFDEGTDGFDTDNNGIIDEIEERETQPPYPVPLRGVQIKIRVYEPDTRQIREVTVVQDFLP